MSDGLFVTVEGIDGAGKSTVVEGIADAVEEDVVTTREPTGLWTGDVVYQALGDEDESALVDFLLFCADRAKHVRHQIEPALADGKIVVSDRYADSTRAYQTHRLAEALGVDYDAARRWMEDVFEPWNLEPDLTIYIDVPVDVALDRCEGEDKYEKRENLRQVKDAYDALYSHCDPDCRIIDGTMSRLSVKKQASNAIRSKLHEPEDTSSQTYTDAL